MTAPVFLAPEVVLRGTRVPLREVTSQITVVLDGDEGRHAAKVQRIRSGECVDLVDGLGFRVRAEALRVTEDGLEVCLLESFQESVRRPQLVLVQALAKGGRDEQAIETATELGVDRVIPWQADRSIVRWSSQRSVKGLERWKKVLTAAMKQSRRSSCPALDQPVSSAQLTAEIKKWSASGDPVLVCHETADVPLRQVLSESVTAEHFPEQVVLIVGPEGGVSSEELAAFEDAGATAVLLGPEVVRSSTAGPAALIVASLILGRW